MKYNEVIEEDEFESTYESDIDLYYADKYHELDVLGMIEKEK